MCGLEGNKEKKIWQTGSRSLAARTDWDWLFVFNQVMIYGKQSQLQTV